MRHLPIALLGASLLAGPVFAQAEKTDPGSLSDKAAKDNPGTTGGATTNPTAKPEDGKGSLSDKGMKDHPGTKGGTTADPTADPKSGSLPDGAKKE